MHISFGIDRRPHQSTLGGTGGGDVVVAINRIVDVFGSHTKSCHAHGVQPNTHGEKFTTQDIGLAHAFNGCQFRLNCTHQVVSHLGNAHLITGKGQIHQGVTPGSGIYLGAFDVPGQI